MKMEIMFLTAFVIIILMAGIGVFADASGNSMQEEECKRSAEELTLNPDSMDDSCLYKLQCEGLKFTTADERKTLENDYLTQLFLRNNPAMSLDDDAYSFGYSAFDPSSAWVIRENQDRRSYPAFSVNFNSCADITSYSYKPAAKDKDDHSIRHLRSINGTLDNILFREGAYDIAAEIMGRHPPPKIQVDEFGISSYEIRCNEGLVLIQMYGSSNACVKPETKQKLMERGWNETQDSQTRHPVSMLSPPDPMSIVINGNVHAPIIIPVKAGETKEIGVLLEPKIPIISSTVSVESYFGSAGECNSIDIDLYCPGRGIDMILSDTSITSQKEITLTINIPDNITDGTYSYKVRTDTIFESSHDDGDGKLRTVGNFLGFTLKIENED